MEGLIPVRVVNQIGTIEDNLDAVEASIRKRVEEYGRMAVTEDTVKEGRQSLADIRKEKAALDKERKAIKAQWMQPYLAFEGRAKKIIALYDEPIEAINSQIKQYDAIHKQEKQKTIQSVYDAVKGEYGDWLPLEKIYDTKWENKSCSQKKIKEDMERLFGQLEISISTIQSMKSEYEEQALLVLKETGSLQMAVKKISELTEAEKLIREKQKHREMDAAAKSDPAEVPETLPAPQAAVPDLPFSIEKILDVTVKVGENDLAVLTDFLEANNLEYEVR